jgi:hypothetical protein
MATIRRDRMPTSRLASALPPDGIGRDLVLEALLTVDGRSGARGALQLHDVHRPRGVLEGVDHPLAGFVALGDEVRSEEGLIERLVGGVDGPVGEHDRDLRGLGLLQDGPRRP